MEHASKTAWQIMCAEDSEVTTYIDEKVHAALCSVYQDRRKQAAEKTLQAGYNSYHNQQRQPAAYGVQQYPGYAAHAGASGQPQQSYIGQYAPQQAYHQAYAQQQQQQQQQPGYGSQAYGSYYAQQPQQTQQQYPSQYSQQPPRPNP
jgi:hypothetical protein